MARFTSASDLAKHQRRRADTARRSMDATTREQAQIALKEAQVLTKGGTKQSVLTAAGHPFRKSRLRGIASKIGGKGRSLMASFPLLPINFQTGRLYRSWRVFARRTGDTVAYRLQNMAKHGKFVLRPGGTKYMVDRGFWAELQRRVIPKARKLSRDALRESNRTP